MKDGVRRSRYIGIDSCLRVNSDVRAHRCYRTATGRERVKDSTCDMKSVPSAVADGLEIQLLSPASRAWNSFGGRDPRVTLAALRSPGATICRRYATR